MAVLVVDDDAMLRRSLARFLGHDLRWSVVAVSCATEARAAVDAAPHRWVGFVLDVGLPEGSRAGVELLRYLSSRCPGVPAAVVTGFVDGRLANDVAAAGASYVCKPPLAPALTPFLAQVAARAAMVAEEEAIVEAAAVEFVFTPREREVVRSVVRGESVARFCEEVGITPRTFRAHSASIRAKTGAASLEELAMTLLRDALQRRKV